jgi:hypothetical protein
VLGAPQVTTRGRANITHFVQDEGAAWLAASGLVLGPRRKNQRLIIEILDYELIGVDY